MPPNPTIPSNTKALSSVNVPYSVRNQAMLCVTINMIVHVIPYKPRLYLTGDSEPHMLAVYLIRPQHAMPPGGASANGGCRAGPYRPLGSVPSLTH